MDNKENLDPVVEKELKKQLAILGYGVSEITPEDEFVKMLRHSIASGTPLRVKCGIDPTGFDVHIGHLVPYRKMRQFQDLGHTGVVIIGDYTASIGDPTGKNESRQSLNLEQVKKNAEKYLEQVFTVVDPKKTEVRHQTEWFSDVGLKDVVGWAAQTTVAKLLSHETFKDRLEEGNPLSLHELFYPMLQGIDSVFVKADVELGGTDQKFNVLMGRDYQKNAGQRQQVAMLLPIILGTCGTQKMSKSLNNYVGILDEPFDKFGKIMSVPDELMIDYFKYITDLPPADVKGIEDGLKDGSLHPNDTKKRLAQTVVSFFHGDAEGVHCREKFENIFKKGGVPEDAPEMEFKRGESLLNILNDSGLFASKGEVRRMFKQGAVKLMEGDKLSDPEALVDDSFAGKVIKVGKRKFLKLK